MSKDSKSLGRDVSVLIKIIENVQWIRSVIGSSGSDFSQSSRGLCNNKFTFDLCSFYMAQIGEKVKLLTEGSYCELSAVVNLSLLTYFRNMIDHDYENIDKVMLQSFIQQVVSDNFLIALKQRHTYCLSNKKS